MNRKQAYEYGVNLLIQSGITDAKTDTMILLEHFCHVTRNDLYAHGEKSLEAEEENRYLDALEKRKTHIPVQHLTGIQEFMGLPFSVNEHVLIPRQDTEILVEEVLRQMQDGFRILDMCTGSGCILLSLLHYSNDCVGVGADISDDALQIAKANAQKLEISAEFIQSDLFEKITGKYDIIVSNPPYIKTSVIATLMEEVKDHEPVIALDGMDDGCYFYRKIIEESQNYLNIGGMLFFEIGYDQAEQVTAMMRDNHFRDVQVVQDYAGLDRVVFGTLFGGN
ncbi:MAG: peptide chain release factor N(5)-glutamine methyltransferase [Lachnospiraceae bacterium]